MTVHDFDMARFVTGSDVVEVFALGAVRVVPGLHELGDLDTAVVTLTHACGAYTVIDNSRQSAYGFDQRVEAFGSRGMASSENPLAHTGLVRTADGTRGERLPHFFLERYLPSYVRELEAFVAASGTGSPPRPGHQRARAAANRPRGAQSAREGSPYASTRSPERMRVLVTGGAGFVGSNVVAVATARGHETIATVRTPPPLPHRSCQYDTVDLLDAAATRAAIAVARPDVIVHTAIYNDFRGIYAERQLAWDAYVGATRTLADAANGAGAALLTVSTDWVFDGTQTMADEATPPNPINYYGVLKAASELVTSSARGSRSWPASRA